MRINSVKEICFFSKVPRVDLSDFGTKLFNNCKNEILDVTHAESVRKFQPSMIIFHLCVKYFGLYHQTSKYFMFVFH